MTKNNTKDLPPKFPANILAPVANMLRERLKTLERNKKVISSQDPFKDTDRVNDNSALDIEADEQNGHVMATALKGSLNRRIIQIRKALTSIKVGKYGTCEECGQMIDTDRLMIYPEATLCAKDSAKREK